MFKPIVTVTAVLLMVVGAAAPAVAHVTVSPKSAAQGGYEKLTIRVPNERDDASTTKVEVVIPAGKVTSVSVQSPATGWTYATEKTGESVTKVVWTANSSAAIKPGEFQEFGLSVGPLPAEASLVLPATQTYSNGEVVRWDEAEVAGASEPEHPAPTLELAPAVESGDAGSAADSSKSSDGSNVLPVIALVLSGVALLVALASLLRKRS